MDSQEPIPVLTHATAPEGVPRAITSFNVLNSDGTPATGIPIAILGKDGSPVQYAVTDEFGAISSEALAGNVAGMAAWRQSTSAFTPLTTSGGTVVSNAPRPAAVYFGQVAGPTGEGLGGVAVRLESADRIAGMTVTDSNGVWLVSAPYTTGQSFTLKIAGSVQPTSAPEFDSSDYVVGPIYTVLPAVPADRAPTAPVSALINADPTAATIAIRRAPHLWSRGVSTAASSPCSPYAPRDAATQVYRFDEVHLFPGEADKNGKPGSCLVFDSAFEPNCEVRYGALVTFEQMWQPLGLALGDVVYSLPLAPCEEVKIATVDWRATQRAQRTGVTQESASQSSQLGRDRAITDIVDAHSNKQATQWETGASLRVHAGVPVVGGEAEAHLGSTWGTSLVNSTIASTQALSDRVREITDVARNVRSVTVVEVSQQEQSSVSTRTVRNHNHCHTLTIQYFEVLQRYLITTSLRAVDPVVLVPFAPIAFGPQQILRYAHLLRRALLDPDLVALLDRWLLPWQSAAGNGVSSPAPAPGTPPATSSSSSAAAADDDPVIDTIVLTLVKQEHKQSPQYPDFNVGGMPDDYDHYLGLSLTNGRTLTFDNFFDTGRTRTKSGHANVTGGLHLSDIRGMRLINTWRESPSDNHFYAQFENVSLELWSHGAIYQPPGEPAYVYSNQVVYPGSPLTVIPPHRVASSSSSSAAASPSTPPASGGASDSTARIDPSGDPPRWLMEHLAANAYYYTAVVAADGDRVLLWTLLDRMSGADGRRLTEICDPTPIGIVGNNVVLRLADAGFLPDAVQRELAHAPWRSTASYPGAQAATVVVLPSPGTFAEAQLGSCSACETKDDSVFWKWQEAPCDGSAPDITADMLKSRVQDMKDLLEFAKSDLVPKPLDVPAAPDPIAVDTAALGQILSDLVLRQLHGTSSASSADGSGGGGDPASSTPSSSSTSSRSSTSSPGSSDATSSDSTSSSAAASDSTSSNSSATGGSATSGGSTIYGPVSVFFDYDSPALRTDAATRDTLTAFVAAYREQHDPRAAVKVVAYASEEGTTDHNQQLSTDRAETVRFRLRDLALGQPVSYNWDAVEGRGERGGSSDAEHRQNRRADLSIVRTP